MSGFGLGRGRGIGAVLLMLGAFAWPLAAQAQSPNLTDDMIYQGGALEGLPASLSVPDLPCMTAAQRKQFDQIVERYQNAMRGLANAIERRKQALQQVAELTAKLDELKSQTPGLGTPQVQKLADEGYLDKKSFTEAQNKFAQITKELEAAKKQAFLAKLSIYHWRRIAKKWLAQYEDLSAQIEKNCAPPQAMPSGGGGRWRYSLASNETHFGVFVGGALLTGLPTSSSSGFFTGSLDNDPVAWGVGGSAFIDVARFGSSPGPFGSAVIGAGLVVDYFGGASLQYHGGCGGFGCVGTGGLNELNYIAELKATTPLSPGNTLNVYVGAGGSTLWPTGQPTGAGGPNFFGSATAPAFRVGWGVDHRLDANWSAGVKIGFQHTGSTEYDTTLAGERFHIDHKNEMLFGATFTWTPGAGP
jgi:hypothetical protein